MSDTRPLHLLHQYASNHDLTSFELSDEEYARQVAVAFDLEESHAADEKFAQELADEELARKLSTGCEGLTGRPLNLQTREQNKTADLDHALAQRLAVEFQQEDADAKSRGLLYDEQLAQKLVDEEMTSLHLSDEKLAQQLEPGEKDEDFARQLEKNYNQPSNQELLIYEEDIKGLIQHSPLPTSGSSTLTASQKSFFRKYGKFLCFASFFLTL
jgi:hypothetical protein